MIELEYLVNIARLSAAAGIERMAKGAGCPASIFGSASQRQFRLLNDQVRWSGTGCPTGSESSLSNMELEGCAVYRLKRFCPLPDLGHMAELAEFFHIRTEYISLVTRLYIK